MVFNPDVIWEDGYSIIEPQIDAAGVHVWPFDSSFPVDVRYLIMRPEVDIRMNVHRYFELLYLDSASAVYQVGNQSYPMQEGDLFVMGGALPHRMTQRPGGRARAVVMYFLPGLIRAYDRVDEAEYLMPFHVQDGGFPHVVPAATGIPAQVLHCMQQVSALLPATDHRSRLTVETYVKMSLVLLLNHYAEFTSTAPVLEHRHRKLERIKPAFDLIEQRYGGVIDVGEAAAAVNMSKSHFMRYFREVTGQPFVAHLNQFRVAKAREYLMKTEHSLAQIAHDVGFCNQSYLTLMFRRATHMTPGEYRNQLMGVSASTPVADAMPRLARAS